MNTNPTTQPAPATLPAAPAARAVSPFLNRNTITRNNAIAEIRAALRARSGKAWSVTGGRGTAWGWITIDAPPARRTLRHRLKAGALADRPEDYEAYDSGQPGGSMTLPDRAELGALLGLEKPVHCQGESIPAGHDYWLEYVQRANGQTPTVKGVPYWD